MRRIFALTVAGALGASVGCTDERVLDLKVTGGMDCECSTAPAGESPRPLFRTLDEGPIAIVIDFITWGDGEVPGCRTNELRSLCGTEGRCRHDPDWRQCTELGRVSPESLSDPGMLLAGFPDAPLPSGPGMLRLVGTRQSCDEVAATGLRASRVFGCAHTCPLIFEEAASPVVLALDSLGGCNEKDVGTCAIGLSTGRRVAAACCAPPCEE